MNKYLEEIDENDIDENGVYTVPNGVEIIIDLSSPKIKKIIFPEGVRIIESSSVMCPNLESIVLPSSLREIGDFGFGKNKLTNETIYGSHTFNMGRKCFSVAATQEYLDAQYELLISYFDQKECNKESIKGFLFGYDRIISHLSREKQDVLSKYLIERLSEKSSGIELGHQLLIETLNAPVLLGKGLLQYVSYKECLKQGVDYQPVIFSLNNLKIAVAGIDDRIDCSYEGALNHASKRTDNSVEEINCHMIYVVSHEIQHLKQRTRGALGTSVEAELLDRLEYLDSTIQSTSSSYAQGYGYVNFHDDSPDEIMADVCAYDSIAEFILSNSNIQNQDKYMDLLNRRKNERIAKAHGIDELGNVTIPDFRLHAYDGLLSRADLTLDEREKVTKIKETYVVIKEAASSQGIDLYASTIGAYFENNSKNTTAAEGFGGNNK